MTNLEKPSFLKNHVDTLAIIGVNLAAIAILVTMWISATSRIDAIYTQFLVTQEQSFEKWNEINEKIYDIWKEID